MANTTLYGFTTLENLMTERVTTVGVDIVADAIRASVVEHNRQINALSQIFEAPTTQFKVRFQTQSDARLQPLDDQGRARPIRPGGFYEVGFPIQVAGSAWGVDRVGAIKMTVAEAQRITAMMLVADIRWMRDHMLACLFDNAGWTYSDTAYGDLAVKGAANGDAVVYTIKTGFDKPATDTHYLAQAGAIADGATTNPYPVLRDELLEHPENSGEVVAFIATNLLATTKGLANWHDVVDPNLRYSANSTILAADLGLETPGTLRGYVDGVWVVEWPSLPNNYILGVTTGGTTPILRREETEPELRGFQQVGVRADHPFFESQWERRAGWGGWNRVGWVAFEISASGGTYHVPTGYAAPML